MSISIETTTSGGEIGDLARAVQWARLLTDAAIPLDAQAPPVSPGTVPASIEVVENDRAAFRLEAFSQVLAQLTEGGWTARPSDLERLIDGRMPEAGA